MNQDHQRPRACQAEAPSPDPLTSRSPISTENFERSPSVESILEIYGERKCDVSTPKISTLSKRKRSDSPSPNSKSAKRQRTSSNGDQVFCHQLGIEFTGFICLPGYDQAHLVARRIYDLPVPEQVTKRLIFYVDGSARYFCGGVGVVWRSNWGETDQDNGENNGEDNDTGEDNGMKGGMRRGSRRGSRNKPPVLSHQRDFKGKGAFFPFSSDDMAAIELFAIASALKFAIQDIEMPHADSRPSWGKRDWLLNPRHEPTHSPMHKMQKELFVFSDQKEALERLAGERLIPSTGYIAEQVADVCHLSNVLATKGIHVELHYSPGHSGIAGNIAAHHKARAYQTAFADVTTSFWPDEAYAAG